MNAGIAHIEAGDFLLGIMTLNEVTAPAAKADSALKARAHTYKAHAYLGLNNPDRARASMMLALDAQRDIDVTAPPFSSALVALVEDLRRAAAMDPEAGGAAAEKSGHFEEAFRAYLRAFQSLPQPAPAADDRRLRERIIEMSLMLPSEPTIPPEASAHFAKATELLEAETLLGGSTAASEAAATELRHAIRLAPWWPEATFKLATVLQKLQRVDEALANLQLYRTADPVGYAAAISAKAAPMPVRSAPPPASSAVVPATATVHIYWPPQQRGSGRPKVYCDGFHVADLQNRHFVVLEVKPGTHDIRFHNSTETFSFAPGQKYYIRTSAEGFPVSGRVRQVPVEEGAAEMRDEGVTSNDPRRTYLRDCSAPAPAGQRKR